MVHKHDARRLHYDLRFEHEGALASWACPKGPSYDPSHKRLAVETEDHPLAYGDFEGRIPDGEYGAGDSLVWDRGTFDTVPPGQFRQQHDKGHLHLSLQGEKLIGQWHLVRTRPQDSGKPQWLLFKAKDGAERYAYDVVTARPESVKTGRTLTRGPTTKATLSRPHPGPDALIEKVWPPMLATLSEPDAAPADQFVYEVKYDGYRALAAKSGARVAAKSRNAIDLLGRFGYVRDALQSLVVGEAVLDGELVGLDEQGRSRFELLGDSDATQRFVVFDVLWLEGEDLRHRPLEERRELLESLVAGSGGRLALAERIEGPTSAAMARAQAAGFEGLLAKRKGSPYTGTRSSDWLKLKVLQTAELAIVGFTPHSTGRNEIGALLLAAHRPQGGFDFAGKVGTGFTQKTRQQLFALLSSDVRKAPDDVHGAPRLTRARWVTPKLVAQLRFTEVTRDGRLRHPSFQGLRDDKTVEQTAIERPKTRVPPRRSVPKPGFFGEAKAAAFGVWHSNRQQAPQVELTNPTRVLFPRSGITKADVRRYYDAVAEFLVPALWGRPLSMQQFPRGIGAPGFFRHAAAAAPDWVTRATVKHADKDVEHIIVDSKATLSWLANQSILTLHMMSSRVDSLESPDWVAFDFDPPSDSWSALVPVAQALRGLLEELKLSSVPKSSGKRGLHVLVPLAPGHTHQQAHGFAKEVVRVLAAQFSSLATDERAKRERRGRLYLDAEQNGRLKSMVAPYSIRAVELAPVSTPLHWDEVHEAFEPSTFTIKTIERRLAREGDLFAPALRGTNRLPT